MFIAIAHGISKYIRTSRKKQSRKHAQITNNTGIFCHFDLFLMNWSEKWRLISTHSNIYIFYQLFGWNFLSLATPLISGKCEMSAHVTVWMSKSDTFSLSFWHFGHSKTAEPNDRPLTRPTPASRAFPNFPATRKMEWPKWDFWLKWKKYIYTRK